MKILFGIILFLGIFWLIHYSAYQSGYENGKIQWWSYCQDDKSEYESRLEEYSNKLGDADFCISSLKSSIENAKIDFERGNFGIGMSELDSETYECIGF